MSTTLRGMGCDKINLIQSIQRRFGYRRFSFQEASKIPEFDRSAFFRLYSDKLILRVSKAKPALYRLATRYSQKARGFVPVLSPNPICQVDCRNYTFTSGECNLIGGELM